MRLEKGAGMGNEIKEAVKSGKILMGSNVVMRSLKSGHVKSIIYASNIPELTKTEMDHYASLSGDKEFNIREYEGDSAKLGEACGKPFMVLLIGIKK